MASEQRHGVTDYATRGRIASSWSGDLAAAGHELVVGLQAEEGALRQAEVAGEAQVRVGGVMARLPSTISLMRRGGTLMAVASAVCDSPIGFKSSSNRILPGCGFGSR